MKKLFSKLRNGAVKAVASAKNALITMVVLGRRSHKVLANNRAEGYIDTAIFS